MCYACVTINDKQIATVSCNLNYKKNGEFIMYIIAGLGNPTSKYEKTRHNVGFDVIDALADKYSIKVENAKHRSLCGSGTIGGEKVLLVKPQTFMNLSGEAIVDALNFYKIDATTNLIVIYDDISMDPGRLRLRKKGSAGGHNGIKNIIAHLGMETFPRIKVGVGAKPDGWDLADYVLSRFSPTDRTLIDQACERAVDAITTIINDDFDKAMNLYNS